VKTEEGKKKLAVSDRGPNDRFAPSANVLFTSIAREYGRHCLGVVLTGMGDDGTEGARAIKMAGGKIVTESAETAVIYGMPRQVAEAGLSDHTVRLENVAQFIGKYGLVQEQ